MQMIELRIEKLPSTLGIAYATSDEQSSDKRGNTGVSSNEQR